MKSDLLSAL